MAKIIFTVGGLFILIGFVLILATGANGIKDYEESFSDEINLISLEKTNKETYILKYKNESDSFNTNAEVPSSLVEINESEKGYDYFVIKTKKYKGNTMRALRWIGAYTEIDDNVYSVYLK